MSLALTVNGTVYNYPEQGDTNWGNTATLWAQAVTTGMLQKAGGSFILTSEVDFGTLHGLMSIYYKARTPNPASTGTLRLGYQNTVAWRNNNNTLDLPLAINSSDQLTFNGVAIQVGPIAVTDTATIDLTLTGSNLSADIKSDSITNAMINSAAAIAYSKLNLSGSIVNADINASAAITLTKLATVTASRALQSSASGVIEPSSVTSTELGYVSGVTSSIQNQLNNKQATGNYITALTGDVTATGPGSAVATIANGAVSLVKMANLAANSIIGNNTGSPATPLALNASQVTAMLNSFVGDSGSGGTKGLVPAPSAGDAAAGKYLAADGTWAAVSSLPSQTGNSGKVLGTNGSAASWGPASLVGLGANGASMSFGVLEENVTLSGASTDSTIKIPERSIVFSVLSRVTTTITGCSSWLCGVSGDTTRFGNLLSNSSGSTNKGVVNPYPDFNSGGTAIRFTASGGGGTFTGGAVRITICYMSFTDSTS